MGSELFLRKKIHAFMDIYDRIKGLFHKHTLEDVRRLTIEHQHGKKFTDYWSILTGGSNP